MSYTTWQNSSNENLLLRVRQTASQKVTNRKTDRYLRLKSASSALIYSFRENSLCLTFKMFDKIFFKLSCNLFFILSFRFYELLRCHPWLILTKGLGSKSLVSKWQKIKYIYKDNFAAIFEGKNEDFCMWGPDLNSLTSFWITIQILGYKTDFCFKNYEIFGEVLFLLSSWNDT